MPRKAKLIHFEKINRVYVMVAGVTPAITMCTFN